MFNPLWTYVHDRAIARFEPARAKAARDRFVSVREFPPQMTDTLKYVYSFGSGKADGKAEMKTLLGGKGANLAEMSSIGIPVPPGFTITTEVCAAYYENGKKLPDAAVPQIEAAIKQMEA